MAATEKTKGAKLHSELANNAWFVAFAPVENPEIAVVALFENGVESYNAVPIVRDVLKAYFDKKARGDSRITTERAALSGAAALCLAAGVRRRAPLVPFTARFATWIGRC